MQHLPYGWAGRSWAGHRPSQLPPNVLCPGPSHHRPISELPPTHIGPLQGMCWALTVYQVLETYITSLMFHQPWPDMCYCAHFTDEENRLRTLKVAELSQGSTEIQNQASHPHTADLCRLASLWKQCLKGPKPKGAWFFPCTRSPPWGITNPEMPSYIEITWRGIYLPVS